jgi:uncharacterized membrane protein
MSIAVLSVLVLIAMLLKNKSVATFLTPFANSVYKMTGLLILFSFSISININQLKDIQRWVLLVLGIALVPAVIYTFLKPDQSDLSRIIMLSMMFTFVLSSILANFGPGRGLVLVGIFGLALTVAFLMMKNPIVTGVLKELTGSNYIAYFFISGLIISFVMQFVMYTQEDPEYSDITLKIWSSVMCAAFVLYLLYVIVQQKRKI